MIIPKFTTKPAGFEMNFRYGIGLQRVWMVDFSFCLCAFRYTDSSPGHCP